MVVVYEENEPLVDEVVDVSTAVPVSNVPEIVVNELGATVADSISTIKNRKQRMAFAVFLIPLL